MKKLALALMCLVSIAFFASCDPEGQPSISAYIEEGYVQDGDVVNVADEVYFGFVVASSPVTNNKLATLVVKIDDQEWETVEFDGETEYTYKDSFSFEAKEIIGETTITAVVTDVAGQTATASITISVEGESAQPLVARTFEWYRLGQTTTGLEEMGLYWEKNIKTTHAQIKPLAGVTLYQFSLNDAEAWENVETDVDKATLFSEADEYIVSVYNNVATEGQNDQVYNDVIGTLMADGTYHLILVEKMHWDAFVSQGYPFHITGSVK